MPIHKIQLVDIDKENADFISKVTFFFKFFFLPLVVGYLMGTWISVEVGVIFGILTLLIIIFRKRIFKKRHKSSNDWQRINRLPDWAFRKMKRKKTNKVKGEHYVYKREGNNFYKKLK